MTKPPFDRRRDTVVAELRATFSRENAEQFAASYHDFTNRLSELGLDAVVPAMTVLLAEPDFFVRGYAAYWVRVIRANSPTKVRRAVDSRAVQVLVQMLRDGDFDARIWALVLLGSQPEGGVRVPPAPDETIPVIQGLLHDPDERLRVLAAAVVLTGTPGDGVSESIRILKRAIRGDDPTLCVQAAGALGRVQLHDREVIDSLVDRLRTCEPVQQLVVVNALGAMGSAAVAAVPALLEVLANESVGAGTRAAVAGTAGAICGIPAQDESPQVTTSRGFVRSALVAARRSEDWRVAGEAAAGLKYTGGLPREVLPVFTRLLWHPEDSVRSTAAQSCRGVGAAAGDVVPALVERLTQETHPGVARLLVEALAAAGGAAVPPLVGLVRAQDPGTVVRAVEALVVIGPAAVPALACDLLGDTDDRVRDIASAALLTLGPRAVTAVPHVMDHFTDPDPGVRLHAVRAVAHVGPGARAAVPGLVELLADPDCDVAYWAQKALALIGPDAVPAVRAALPRAEAPARELMEELLAYFGGGGVGPEADGFEWVGDDDKIVLFAWVGQKLAAKAPQSRRALARELERLSAARGWRYDFPTSESGLRERLDKFEETLGRAMNRPLTLFRSEEKKGIRLTPEGEDVLARVVTYLRKKGRLLVPGHEAAGS